MGLCSFFSQIERVLCSNSWILSCSGIDVRSSYDDGVTALHLASCKGHVSFVDLLLKSRCPPDIGTRLVQQWISYSEGVIRIPLTVAPFLIATHGAVKIYLCYGVEFIRLLHLF